MSAVEFSPVFRIESPCFALNESPIQLIQQKITSLVRLLKGETCMQISSPIRISLTRPLERIVWSYLTANDWIRCQSVSKTMKRHCSLEEFVRSRTTCAARDLFFVGGHQLAIPNISSPGRRLLPFLTRVASSPMLPFKEKFNKLLKEAQQQESHALFVQFIGYLIQHNHQFKALDFRLTSYDSDQLAPYERELFRRCAFTNVSTLKTDRVEHLQAIATSELSSGLPFRLTSLTLDSITFSNADAIMRPYLESPSLTEVTLADCRISSGSVKCLAFQHLRSFSLINCQSISVDAITCFPHLRALRQLSLIRCYMPFIVFKALAKSTPDLTSFAFSSLESIIQDYSSISLWSKLQHLRLFRYRSLDEENHLTDDEVRPLSVEEFASIVSSPALETLALANCIPLQDPDTLRVVSPVGILARIATLRVLDLTNEPFEHATALQKHWQRFTTESERKESREEKGECKSNQRQRHQLEIRMPKKPT